MTDTFFLHYLHLPFICKCFGPSEKSMWQLHAAVTQIIRIRKLYCNCTRVYSKNCCAAIKKKYIHSFFFTHMHIHISQKYLKIERVKKSSIREHQCSTMWDNKYKIEKYFKNKCKILHWDIAAVNITYCTVMMMQKWWQ